MIVLLGCRDLFMMSLTPGHCCLSCHEDYDDYGYDMCHGKLINGREFEVCCDVLRDLEEQDLIEH